MKENNPLVKLENAGVYKSSKWLVKGISFEVNNGQIVTLIGPNGSGKTTTAKMILNILNADEGLVTSNTNKLYDDVKNSNLENILMNPSNGWVCFLRFGLDASSSFLN